MSKTTNQTVFNLGQLALACKVEGKDLRQGNYFQPRNAELRSYSSAVSTRVAQASQAVVTMTSLELVDFINELRGPDESELRHDHFMVKVPKVLGENYAPKFLGTQGYGNNNTRAIYSLPKREACLMAMSYSYELQAKVFDRMTALEARQAPAVPQSMAQALRLAAEQAEALERQQTQLALAAPKVEFVDRYVQAETGSMGLRQVCKLLGAKETEFTAFLLARELMYRTTERGPLTPRAEHIHNGRFKAKTGTADHGDRSHAYVHYKFTAKGVEWITRLWIQKNQTEKGECDA